jgi:RNA polymerase sigma-70 factor (ECF subfamily)
MDRDIVKGIMQKDEQAFEKMYHQYKDLVYYVIYQIVGNKEATKELSQDTFLTVYKKIEQYKGGNFKYWLLQIAKNLAKNYVLRVQVKDAKIVHNDEIVLDTVDKQVTSLGIYDELLSLHFEQQKKDIIVYHVVFGYSYKEISDIMQIPPKVIGKEYRDSITKLKTLMKEI